MTDDSKVLDKIVDRALSGKGAHVEAEVAFEGLDWRVAGVKPEGAPHSLFQLLNHLNYWQDWVVRWLAGEDPPIPERASGSWTDAQGPATPEEWEETVARFLKGIESLKLQSREKSLFTQRGEKTRLEILQTIASHNSYHLGQVSSLRRMLGAWPPPSGGLTW